MTRWFFIYIINYSFIKLSFTLKFGSYLRYEVKLFVKLNRIKLRAGIKQVKIENGLNGIWNGIFRESIAQMWNLWNKNGKGFNVVCMYTPYKPKKKKNVCET